MKKIAILQSNYIPWKGYFDLIGCVDEFILYDDMQFTKNDWRNRNKLKTPKGLEWISIPVGADINRRIRDVSLPNNGWQKKHMKRFEVNYGRSLYYDEVMALIGGIYINNNFATLTDLNRSLIECICDYMNIKTKISFSWNYDLGEGKTERLVNLCKQTNAQIYVSGPTAKSYLNEQLFDQSNIAVQWFDYTNYKEYPQLWGGFEHEVSIIDLLFNCGKNSRFYMKFPK